MTSAQEWVDKDSKYAKDGNFAKALDCFNESLKLNLDNAAAYGKKASVLLELKRYEEAEEAAGQAINCDYRDMWAYNWLGLAEAKLKKYIFAMKHFEEAIDWAERAKDTVCLESARANKAAFQLEMDNYNKELESNVKANPVDKTIQIYLDRANDQKQKNDIEKKINSKVQETFKRAEVVKKDDLKVLKEQIQQLQDKLDELIGEKKAEAKEKDTKKEQEE